MENYNDNQAEKSSARAYMIGASVIEVLKTLAYFVSTVIMLVAGCIAYLGAQNADDGTEGAIAAGAGALVGVLLILAGVALAVCYVIALANMIVTVTSLKRGKDAILAKRGRIIAGVVLSAIACVVFVIALIATIATGNANVFVIAVCAIMAVLDGLSAGLKVGALKKIADIQPQE